MWIKTPIYIALMALTLNHQAWSQTEPMEHDHSTMQGGEIAADARDPLDYSGTLRYNNSSLKRLHLMDQHTYKALIVDHLEQAFTDDKESTAFEIKAWIGSDYNKLQLQTEGHSEDGKTEAHSEVYWAHAISAYWDSLIGARFDSGDHTREWLGLGIQGLAPYLFYTSAKAFVNDQGRVAAELELKYELMFSQDIELEPKIKATLYSEKEADFGEGSGLAELKTALRLKYHIKPEFAPYIGVEWQNLFGETADMAKQAGHSTGDTRYLIGLSFWY